MQTKRIQEIYSGTKTKDGAGVHLTRMIGNTALEMFDPFLMLDIIDSDDPGSYIAGFPDHPHRGFETVTIMLEGTMRHKDSIGNQGILNAGDIQWMTAGRRVIHSEIPEMVNGRLKGFQLWVNLPATQKMLPARYQNIAADKVPLVPLYGGQLRIITGIYNEIEGAAIAKTPIRILDVSLDEEILWRVDVNPKNDFFICVYGGSILAVDSDMKVSEIFAPATVLFDGPGAVEVMAGKTGAELLFCEGRPIRETVARYGPFVMNTRKEIEKAIEDFNAGILAVT